MLCTLHNTACFAQYSASWTLHIYSDWSNQDECPPDQMIVGCISCVFDWNDSKHWLEFCWSVKWHREWHLLYKITHGLNGQKLFLIVFFRLQYIHVAVPIMQFVHLHCAFDFSVFLRFRMVLFSFSFFCWFVKWHFKKPKAITKEAI